jgi:Dihydrouridine synthase (Dus)
VLCTRWLDLNCGCPIHEATRRGLGAALLRRPTKLARLVEGIAGAIDLPLTVKIRTGESEDKVNVQKVGRQTKCVSARRSLLAQQLSEARRRAHGPQKSLGAASGPCAAHTHTPEHGPEEKPKPSPSLRSQNAWIRGQNAMHAAITRLGLLRLRGA